jgi:hypothetical protein
MVKEAFFATLYELLKDTAQAIDPQAEPHGIESIFASDLLIKWRDLCIGLSAYSLGEFMDWARSKEGI